MRAKLHKQLTVYAMIRRWSRFKRECWSGIISPVKDIVVIILWPARAQSIVKGAAYTVDDPQFLNIQLSQKYLKECRAMEPSQDWNWTELEGRYG